MIVCFGATPAVQRSMIFDRLEIDAVNRATDVGEYASGKSPNVARVLTALGAQPLAVGFAGGDRGTFLVEDLTRAGVRCQFVIVAAQTRQCSTLIDRSSGTATELIEESVPVSADDWDRMDAALRTLLANSSTWVFSGSLPAGAPQDFYARWVPLAKERGATLILDARGEPMKLALPIGGFIAKLNREELAQTLGETLDCDESLRACALRAAPAGATLIVTLGARGAIAVRDGRAWRVEHQKVKVVSAIGSGDAFAGGLALALERGENLPEALALAAACGAANALTSRAGHVVPEDVERLRQTVKIQEI